MIDIEKAASEFATTNANEWYSPAEIKSDGGYRWSVHRDGAEEGYKMGFAAATAEAKEREALLMEYIRLVEKYAARLAGLTDLKRIDELRASLGIDAAPGEKENR